MIRFAGTGEQQVTELDDGLKILPVRSGRGTGWSLQFPLITVVGAWLEQVPGRGEDAEPSFLYQADHGRGLIAAYDGVGGSGSATFRRTPAGEEYTGAYVASRLARQTTEAWFKQAVRQPGEVPPRVDELHRQLARRFSIELAQTRQVSSRIAGSLVRTLPTTLASMMFVADAGQVTVMPLWAGDSRCHLLTPSGGLQQLTIDDSPIPDALGAILNDAPMTNLVCEDRDFTIHSARFRFPIPLVLIAATDGCYGYMATPAHFEYLVLVALLHASSADEWGQNLLREITRFAGDDASLVVAALGFQSFDEVRRAFRARAEWLERWHLAPFRSLAPGDRAGFETLRQASWNRYRPGYERHLPRNLAAGQS